MKSRLDHTQTPGNGKPRLSRASELIKSEIEERFGFFPPFFDPALETPEILDILWHQTFSAYVNNSLPILFKEKLFAYLSRYCAVPYCIICHSCALRPLGMTAAEVLALLSEPAPATDVEIGKHLNVLAAQSSPLEEWPTPGSALDESLMACSVFSFLNPRQAEDCRAQLRRLLGNVKCDYLMMLLGYVKTCHLWVEAHPELSYEADKRAQENLGYLLAEEPRLAEFFSNYNELIARERQGLDERLRAERRKSEQALREDEARLARVINSAMEAVISVDGQQRIILFNAAAEKIFGYSAAEVRGRPISILIPERFRASHQHLVELAALLDQSHEAIVVRDLDSRIHYWSRGAERLYGWTAEEAIGRPVQELIYRGDLSQLVDATRIVVEKGGWNGELRQGAKGGREVIVEGHWTLVRDADGKPKYILAINTDITEKKELES